MEIQRKHRIIGGALLAVGIIIGAIFVIKWLVAEPPSSTELPLPGAPSTEMTVELVLFNEEATLPTSITNVIVDSDTAEESEPGVKSEPVTSSASSVNKTTKKAQTKTPKKSAQLSSLPANGLWLVQVGSFTSQANVDSWRKKLKTAGLNAQIKKVGKATRVAIGPYKDRRAAQEGLKKLQKLYNVKGTIIKN